MRGAPTLARATLGGLCPRCGAATLFAGPVRIAPTCPACGLAFDRLAVDDGPAALLILLVGAIVLVGGLVVEFGLAPPWWVHLGWIPVTVGLTLVGLRLAKAALAFQLYRHDAREGRRLS